MPTYLTPGVYFEKPEPREPPAPQRTDVAGFVGLAERGPLHTPTRLTSWRQFQQVFGGFLPHAYLAYAVRAFFENGGRACWVVRVADAETAQPARAQMPDSSGGVAYQVEASSPGTWGQELAVSVQAAGLAATQHVVLPGLAADRLGVDSISGFEPGTWLRLTQTVGGSPLSLQARVLKVDPVLGILRLNRELAAEGLLPDDAGHPISVESLEFTLLVWQADQPVERHENLAPDTKHSRWAVTLVNETSRLIQLARGSGDALPLLPWRGPLDGGGNGLRTLDVFDYVGTPQGDAYGLAKLAKKDEVSLLAIPDLTIRPQRPAPSQRRPVRRINECALDASLVRADVVGTVVDAETADPLPGVKVSDGLQEVTTGNNGRFTLVGLLPGTVDLALSMEGYLERIERVTVQSSGGEQDLGEIALNPLDLPPALSEADIAYGQAAMIAQCESLRDRFALIDPPLPADGSLLDVSGLQSWRARFDTPFAAIYYPWLLVRDPLQPSAPQGRLVPPCGHVAGVYAASDLAEGVHRPPANRALAWVDDVAAEVDDALHGLLNPQGINVIRSFPGRGIRIFGARTLSSDSAWRFVNVRRLMSMLEETLYNGLQWAVFEPNGPELQFGLRLAITTLLDGMWRRGAFLGDRPEAAYRVRCDEVTTPEDAQASGQIIAEVGVAPTVPYEFIVLRLGLTTDELQISEV